MFSIAFSRCLALCLGIAVPLVETARRFHQLADYHVWPLWLDDWLIGGFLLLGVWRTKNDAAEGQAFLAGAWGFTCAMVYASFFSQLAELNVPDPSGVSPTIVVTIKGLGLLLSVAALIGTLRWKPAT